MAFYNRCLVGTFVEKALTILVGAFPFNRFQFLANRGEHLIFHSAESCTILMV